VHDEDVVARLQEIAHEDWKNSHPLDLSDEGYLPISKRKEKAGKKTLH
jgi:hypothetical protein